MPHTFFLGVERLGDIQEVLGSADRVLIQHSYAGSVNVLAHVLFADSAGPTPPLIDMPPDYFVGGVIRADPPLN